MFDNLLVGVLAAIGTVVLIVAVGLLVSWPMSMLWNYCLVPAVSGVKEVGIVQMWGIIVLVGYMFKSQAK